MNNILLIGAGGREHALGHALSKSEQVSKLYYIAGIFTDGVLINPALSSIATPLSVAVCNGDAIVEQVKKHNIHMVVIGPEAPLAEGVSDLLRKHNILVFGASKAAAQLETSKDFTKQICLEKNIPTAHHKTYVDLKQAIEGLKDFSYPLVIKADGLASGKGVVIANNETEALTALENNFQGAFGEAGKKVLLEAFLHGTEASFFVLCDGEKAIPLTSAQDHKRAFDGDQGPNTGGMGAYSPSPLMTDAMTQKVMETIIEPTLEALKERNITYQGVLYAGLMICNETPYLIEYNARFGDPECQILMQRLETDLYDLLYGAATSFKEMASPQWSKEVAITIVMAAEGYPSHPKTGGEILLPSIEEKDIFIYQAGTKQEKGKLLANGGRVLNITARAQTIEEARQKAYNTIEKIEWDDGFYRRDIGKINISS